MFAALSIFGLKQHRFCLMKKFIIEIPKIKSNNHPVHYAALLHKELVSIHPFIDGNGRISRLVMHLALIKKGYPIMSIPLILRKIF